MNGGEGLLRRAEAAVGFFEARDDLAEADEAAGAWGVVGAIEEEVGLLVAHCIETFGELEIECTKSRGIRF